MEEIRNSRTTKMGRRIMSSLKRKGKRNKRRSIRNRNRIWSGKE